MKNEKQIFTLSKSEIIKKLVMEIERVQDLPKTKTNRATVKRMFKIYDMIKNADSNFTAKVEGVRGNHKIRTFEMFNVGSMLECLVEHYTTGKINCEKSFEDENDLENGFMPFEIKTSLENARCTTNTKAQALKFINNKGAYIIKKDAFENIKKDSKGKLYENLDYSVFKGVRLNHSLSQKLGLI
ncbi:MAG: hypothetical protein ACOCRX_04800 [Candidatus Woesearchaeota archaeon]